MLRMSNYEHNHQKDGNRRRNQREGVRSFPIMARSIFRNRKTSLFDERTIEKCEEMALNTMDTTIIAKDGERVIGFVQYGKYNYDDLEDAGEIIALYVLADYYGKGIGYRLMQEAMQYLSDYPQIALFVIKDNQRAIDFYTRYGFRFDGQEGMTQIGATVARMVLKR